MCVFNALKYSERNLNHISNLNQKLINVLHNVSVLIIDAIQS